MVAAPAPSTSSTGHKWFMSAPMCDAFLVLAQADGGLSCFLLPRWTPDGERNRFRLQRLKDKLGNWSNASSEIELDGASAWLVGEEGAGVADHPRDGQPHPARLRDRRCRRHPRRRSPRRSTTPRHRSVFGRRLVDQPLMQNVLADLAVESEAATVAAMRAGPRRRRGDRRRRGGRRSARIATAVGKYWVCKRAPMHADEALECLGGAGYVEESSMPRLYREAPLNSIWEGTGNVQCLDVLRAMIKSPASLEAFFAEVQEGAVGEPRLQAYAASLRDEIPGDVETIEVRARRLVEKMALALQACCWSATATKPSPTPSVPPASPATGAKPSAPSPPEWTSPASSPATARIRAPDQADQGRRERRVLRTQATEDADMRRSGALSCVLQGAADLLDRDHSPRVGRRRRPPSGRRSGAGSGC